ncbi:MAG: helicase C-terminal domain-containing protein [Sphaerochaetaceae bacterium]
MNKLNMYDVFDVGGILDKHFSGYEFREGQLEMARLIAQAYEHSSVAAIEAGTGIGKSFAYLVPAFMHALDHPKERTVVATSTINLQKQLFDKDVVQLFNLLEIELPVALVVGRANYLCLYRLSELIKEQPLLAQDPTSELGSLVAWAKTTTTGLRSDCPTHINSQLWSEVCSDPDFCLGYSCPFSKECFYLKSRKEASEASLIITNHHLLFTDARSRMIDHLTYDDEAVLPPFQHVIFDEAHNVEKNATSYFTLTYNSYEMYRLIRRLQGSTRSKSMFEPLSEYVRDDSLVDSAVEHLQNLADQVGYLDTYVSQKYGQSGEFFSVLITPEQQHHFKDALPLFETVITEAKTYYTRVQSLVEKGRFPDELEYTLHQIMVSSNRLLAHTEALQRFIDFSNWGDDIYWIEKDKQRIDVNITPLSVAPAMQQTIFNQLKTVVCTSATLDLADDFTYWGSRIGLPPAKREYLKAVYSSPFNFKENLLLLTPSDAPIFSEKEQQEYIDYVSKSVKEAILTTAGGALILFTSYKMLMAVHQTIQQDIEKADLTLMRQGEGDRSRILSRFLSDTDSVLLATDSFWEGVDAPGEALRLVVIVKLPFRLPTDPVFKARQAALDREGKGGFFHLALPEATMKLKQGFGRLLRNTHDKGIVIILDSRVVHKQYGSWMIRALPESYHPETTTSHMGEKIESFLFG